MPEPIFIYSAVNAAGKIVQGRVFAPTAKLAEKQLRDKGLSSVVVRLDYLPKETPRAGSKSPTQKINIDSPKEIPTQKFHLECPGCSNTLRLNVPLLNRKWKCPECKLKFAIESTDKKELIVKLFLSSCEPEPQREWHDVLSIAPDSSLSDIRKSYRKLIQKYHPDKVADLGAELIHLAEQRTKEINSAYEQALAARR